MSDFVSSVVIFSVIGGVGAGFWAGHWGAGVLAAVALIAIWRAR